MHQMDHNIRKLPKLNKYLNIYKHPSITNPKSHKHSPSPLYTSPPPLSDSVCYQQMSLLLALQVAHSLWQMWVLQLHVYSCCSPYSADSHGSDKYFQNSQLHTRGVSLRAAPVLSPHKLGAYSI